MTRYPHRYGMHYSAETVGSFEKLVQFGERSRDKVSLEEFAVRDLAAEQREEQKQAQLRAAIATIRSPVGSCRSPRRNSRTGCRSNCQCERARLRRWR